MNMYIKFLIIASIIGATYAAYESYREIPPIEEISLEINPSVEKYIHRSHDKQPTDKELDNIITIAKREGLTDETHII